MNYSVAIVVVAYNRHDSLNRLLHSIENAWIEPNTTIIISIDKSDNALVEDCAKRFVWPFGEKRIVLHRENLGLKRHILGCGNFLDEFDAIVVLEDDLVVAKGFYTYARLAVNTYFDDENIAGISLYSFHINPHTDYPFFPSKDQHDAYFIQYAPSWGQVWMKNQWNSFIKWYNENSDDDFKLPHLPINISHWGEKSWLKYHIKYAIEKSKYFVYPYFAFSTTNSDIGEHANVAYTYFQVVLQEGIVSDFRFPILSDSAIRYDSSFEREFVIDGYDDLCIDLNGTKGNRRNQRYWLTTLSQPFKIIKSYQLRFKPIEANISDSNIGGDIYLYDTSENCKSPTYSYRTKWYLMDVHFMLLHLRNYGFLNLLKEFGFYLKKKVIL